MSFIGRTIGLLQLLLLRSRLAELGKRRGRHDLEGRILPGPQAERVGGLMDEHPDSINDGRFSLDPASDRWIDLPASYHNGACGFAFGDNHSEIKKWTTSGKNGLAIRAYYASNPEIIRKTLGWDNPDLKWLRFRTSSRRDGTPIR